MDYSDALFSDNIKRIAVFSDIHGNRQALNAILNDINQKDIKEVVFNGDQITSSAHSEDVVKRIKELGIPCTRGNHERYLHELYDPNDEKWQLDNWAVTRYEFETLDENKKQWLINLPENLCLVEGDAPLLMTHAAPGNDRARISGQCKEEEWEKLFRPLPQNCTLIGSHLHRFWQHRWNSNYFVRTPSAGLPLDSDTRAGYCILERQENTWTVQECRIPYDLDKELSDFKNSEYYQVGGVFAHVLWLELATGRWHTGPFFEHLANLFPEGQEERKGYTHDEMNEAWEMFNRNNYPDYDPDK